MATWLEVRQRRSWILVVTFLVVSELSQPARAQQMQVPSDYGIDLQLAVAARTSMMSGASEIVGTSENNVGDEVFHRLVSSGFTQPYPWKLTLVNNGVVNASSTAYGQIYVDGGLLSVIGENRGLWAAVLSHETVHTGLRHQVQVYYKQLYIEQTIQYYRARARAGDKYAPWSLVAFQTASLVALKKFERDQEHEADQRGMFLMARAGYHPDFVFALHHLLLMRSGEQSKFAAFFSDHPRWETRDQRDDKVYTDALAEFNRLWPDASASPGGRPPVVVFVGQPLSAANKPSGSADISIPMYCRNTERPVNLIVRFTKSGHPVKAANAEFADAEGNLVAHDEPICLDKGDGDATVLHVPASAVSEKDRSLKAEAFVSANGEVIAASRKFDVHFPKVKRK